MPSAAQKKEASDAFHAWMEKNALHIVCSPNPACGYYLSFQEWKLYAAQAEQFQDGIHFDCESKDFQEACLGILNVLRKAKTEEIMTRDKKHRFRVPQRWHASTLEPMDF
jgi:hypothetical protein